MNRLSQAYRKRSTLFRGSRFCNNCSHRHGMPRWEQLDPRMLLAADLQAGALLDGIDLGSQSIESASIHGVKWLDENGNGTRDANEPGLPGVTIYLDVNLNEQFDDGEPSAVTMEDITGTPQNDTGRYWLDGVEPGFYLVREVVPDGFVQTFPEVLLCRAIFCTGRAHLVNLEPGDVLDGIDFGNQPSDPGSIHGVKWLDENGNGERDANEPGLPGVTIYLDVNLNARFDEGEPSAVTMEDLSGKPQNDTGRYWLDDVTPGSYLVREVVPDGFEQTFPRRDTRVDQSTTVVIEPGVALDYDLTGVEVSSPSSGDIDVVLEMTVVWPDSCGSLIPERATHEVMGNLIHVEMFGEQVGTICAEVISPETQRISVGSLDPGTYAVMATLHEDLGVASTSFVPTLGVEGAITVEADGSHAVALGPGERLEDIDFGNRKLLDGSIHGVKWVDANGNGQRDPNEPGLPGVTIYLDVNLNGEFDENEPNAVTMEDNPITNFDESGMYWLTDLHAGTHVVREILSGGVVQTFPEPGTNVVHAGGENNPPQGEVQPTLFDATLGAGDVLQTHVSWTFSPFCVRPFDVDVEASEPDVVFENLTGVLVNGCGGETSTFDVRITGDGMPRRFDLLFVDDEFGGILGSIPVEISAPIAGDGAHIVPLGIAQTIERIDFGNQPIKGDMDCDGDVDFDDFDDFVHALRNPDWYVEVYGVPPSLKGDFDMDGDHDFDDIKGFVRRLGTNQDTVKIQVSGLEGEIEVSDLVRELTGPMTARTILGASENNLTDPDQDGDFDFDDIDDYLATLVSREVPSRATHSRLSAHRVSLPNGEQIGRLEVDAVLSVAQDWLANAEKKGSLGASPFWAIVRKVG